MKLLAFLGGVVAAVVTAIYGGWVISLLWLWFAVPYFGVTPISIPMAIGLRLLIIHIPPMEDPAKSPSPKGSLFVYSLIMNTFVLAIGFIASYFV